MVVTGAWLLRKYVVQDQVPPRETQTGARLMIISANQ